MKKIAAIFVALALFPAISSASQDSDAIKAKATATASVQTAAGRIYVVNGDVFVAQGKDPAHRVIGNEAIVPDTLINTGDKSSALLRFEDGQVVTIQANSTFQVRDYRYDARKIENSNIVFSMLKGGMRFITGLIGQKRKQAFRLLTPNATIGIRGTEFMVAMAGKSMYSQVLTGKIGMTNATGSTVLGAGQTAVLASSPAAGTMVSASATPAGTFTELLSIPVNPSAIPAPAPTPAPAPAPASAPAPAPVSMPAAPISAAGAAAGTAIGVAGSALAGTEDSTPATTQAIEPPAEVSIEESTENKKKDSRSGKGITGKIGTLGYGAELNFGLSDSIGARIGLNAYTYKYNDNSNQVNYDFKLQLQTVSALADWYPFSGSFRASGGLLYNNNKVSMTALPASGTTYTINGVSYTTTQISSLQGEMTFNKVAPYLGIGWGNPVAKDKGWGLVTDVGVLLQGKPKTSLTATCPGGCSPSIQYNVAAENTRVENDLSNFKFWPVASIGISYQW